jgi:plasmid stabilization system protein ParE
MKYRYHPEARIEFSEALGFYHEIDLELADRLNHEIARAIRTIVANPLIRRLRQNTWRRYNLNRFPYYLPYAIENDQIVILAIAHNSRKPGYWKNRIS